MTQPDGPIEIRHPAPGATFAEHARAILLIVLLTTLVGYFDSGRGDLLNSLETGYVLTVHEMARDGDWLVPQVNDRPRLNKPPLPFWIGAAAATVFEDGGASIELLRAVCVGFGALTAIFVYLLGTRMFDRRAGLWSALVWVTMYLPVYEYTFARHDIFLVAFCAMSLLGLWKAWQRERFGWTITAIGMVLAFQCKGPVSWVFTALPAVLFALLYRPLRWKYISIVLAIGLAAGATLLPWMYAVQDAIGRDEWNRFMSEGFYRMGEEGRPSNSPAFYLLFFAYVLPWVAYFIAGLVVPWEKRFANRASAMRFAWVCVVAGLVFMTIPRERETRYVVPLAAPAALLIGALLSFHLDLWRRKIFDPKAMSVLIGHAVTLIGCAIALPIVLWKAGWVEPGLAAGSMVVLLAVALDVAWGVKRRNMMVVGAGSVLFGVLLFVGVHAAQLRVPQMTEPLRERAIEASAIVGDAPIASWPTKAPQVFIYHLNRTAPTIADPYLVGLPPDQIDKDQVLADWIAGSQGRTLFVITPGHAMGQLKQVAQGAGLTATQALDLTTRKPREKDEMMDPLFLMRLVRLSDADGRP